MRRLGCLLAFASAGILTQTHIVSASHANGGSVTPTVVVPTVSVPGQAVTVPTVAIPPRPTATPRPTPVKKAAAKHAKKTHQSKKKHAPRKQAPRAPAGTWIAAFLTSYCPGSAGWISSSGLPVFYGMLANNYYSFGTRVYLPIIGITGVVEDRVGAATLWDHFDVWSPVCYSTPTGWYRVEVLR